MLAASKSSTATATATTAQSNGKNAAMTLRLIGGEEEPRVRKLRLPTTVGRLHQADSPPAANNAVFLSEFLSRRHAEFFSDPTGQVYVKDLNSSNGTFLNGNQLKGMQPVLLQENDIIQFGTEDEDVERESVVIVQVQLPSASHHYHNGTTTGSTVNKENSPPIYSKVHKKPLVDAQMSSQQRLTDVMRKLSSLGMQITSGTGTRVDGGVLSARLEMVEEAVEACLSSVTGGSGDPKAHHLDTIHTRPSLRAALNIITVYETVFMMMAALMVYLWVQW